MLSPKRPPERSECLVCFAARSLVTRYRDFLQGSIDTLARSRQRTTSLRSRARQLQCAVLRRPLRGFDLHLCRHSSLIDQVLQYQLHEVDLVVSQTVCESDRPLRTDPLDPGL